MPQITFPRSFYLENLTFSNDYCHKHTPLLLILQRQHILSYLSPLFSQSITPSTLIKFSNTILKLTQLYNIKQQFDTFISQFTHIQNYLNSSIFHSVHINKMKYHENLYLKRSTCIQGISTIIQYLTTNLIQTLDHPSRTMEKEEMYSFLCGVLQIYLELWNSTQPHFEYIPDLMCQTINQPLEQHKAAISEITPLLKHIQCYQFFPHVNNLHSMEKLEKLNSNLISLLKDYFNQTIWKPSESQN